VRELSLFSGAGGGLLGSLLLGWQPIGYVEFNDYCQRVIAQRIADGILPNAPIFGDIRSFVSEGYAAAYTGLVDVISGGFPCQPFSVAGKRAGADDPRNMWPATAECVRIVRPRYCFFENVPGLLNSGYFGRIVADLAACGYGVLWRVLSAAELGAPHQRKRLWIVAHTEGGKSIKRERRVVDETLRSGQGADAAACACGQDVADANGGRRKEHVTQQKQSLPHSAKGGWWSTEPDVGRLADGYAGRVAELKALGNAQVPIVAATAWRLLTGDNYYER
jgi:DNA (cytosine-5)-methyltransferase 1